MNDSKQLTDLTKSQYNDTVVCYLLKGMGFVGTFKSLSTAKKVVKEWAMVLGSTTNKIEKDGENYKVTSLV